MDIFESNIDEILKITNEQNKFAKKWFINYSELDDEQKRIYNDDSYNFIVKGCAGSGKTILAVHKLYKMLSQHEEGFSSYLFTVYTKALMAFIKDGFDIFLRENEENKNLFKFNIDKANIINIDKLNIDKLYDGLEYLIIDEVQDIAETDFLKLVKKFKNIMVFGDDEQQLYYKNGMLTMEKIQKILGNHFKTYELDKTYRLPYSIANFASDIIGSNIEKKTIDKDSIKYIPNKIECKDINEEIHFIIEEIYNRDLKDVAIIIHKRESAKMVSDIILKKIDEIYGRDKNREKPKFNFKIDGDIDKLSFLEENSITLMVFHSSKGTEFENVFIPKCDEKSIYSTKFNYHKALFVACTRCHKNLYITHSEKLTRFISKIDKNKYNSYKYIDGALIKV